MAESARSPAYFAIIPANVRYHTALSPNAKLLYGEITALADQTGYCWASNKYLAERFLWGERTVSRLIAQMQELELITIEMVPVKNGRERRIFVGQTVAGGLAKIGDTPSRQNWLGGLANIGDQNNKEEDIPPYNPPKGDEKPRRRTHKWTADWNPDRFEAFWTYYRTHVRPENRQAAIRAWDKLQPSDELIARIGRALQKQLQTQAWKDGIGIPYASTYLNNARWEDAEGLPDPPAETVPKEAYGWQQ
ncbi:MAG: helix-turn-helix domain-containing protein [Oscillibacter sp.]|nr:helix-turn-helix domain-containing protein [Oscillibacter sp.]